MAEAHELVAHAVEETRAGYQALSQRDAALFHLLTSFSATAVLARLIALRLRSASCVGPFRNLTVSDRHIHHFVPGLALVFVSGAGALLCEDPSARAKLAIPFGAGMGLALDESALLLHLDDVYWQRAGLVGFQITLAAMAGLASWPLARRLRQQGIAEVAEQQQQPAGSPIPVAA